MNLNSTTLDSQAKLNISHDGSVPILIFSEVFNLSIEKQAVNDFGNVVSSNLFYALSPISAITGLTYERSLLRQSVIHSLGKNRLEKPYC